MGGKKIVFISKEQPYGDRGAKNLKKTGMMTGEG